MEPYTELTIEANDRDQYKRLDQYLNDKLPDISRTFIKKLYENGLITSEQKLELKKIPATGTVITVHIPPPTNISLEPQDIPLEILFEDEHLIVINKQAGLVTHPAPGNYDGTLVNALLFHCKNLPGIGGKIRPGIVHRLDKGTSGVMVAAKSDKAMENLIITFQKHDIKRQYQALVFGDPGRVEGKLEATIGRHPIHRKKMAAHIKTGKAALTFFKCLEVFSKVSHLELTLETGRTHQIRVHLSSLLKTPILADKTYADVNRQIQSLPEDLAEIIKGYEYPFLHAKCLEFNHPVTNEYIAFKANPPEVFSLFLNKLREKHE